MNVEQLVDTNIPILITLQESSQIAHSVPIWKMEKHMSSSIKQAKKLGSKILKNPKHPLYIDNTILIGSFSTTYIPNRVVVSIQMGVNYTDQSDNSSHEVVGFIPQRLIGSLLLIDGSKIRPLDMGI